MWAMQVEAGDKRMIDLVHTNLRNERISCKEQNMGERAYGSLLARFNP